MIVRVATAARVLVAGERTMPCAIGRGVAAAAADKREGDGATPLGTWPVRAVLLRPDRLGLMRSPMSVRVEPVEALQFSSKQEGQGFDKLSPNGLEIVAPAPSLPWRWLRRDDGWSDDPADPAYNRVVRHPHGFSAERLWREDGLYDVIVVLGHNDAPPVAGMGSAIFLHCWREGEATEGCVAVAREALLGLLPELGPGSAVVIA